MQSDFAVPPQELQKLFLLFNAARYAEMAAAAQHLTQRYPTDGQAWKALGVARMVEGQDALSALQQATQLLPHDAEVASNLGGLLTARGEHLAAIKCYRQALKLQPRFAQAHSNLAEVLVKQSAWEEAQAHCHQALELQPGLAAAHVNLANARMGQKQPDAAIASYHAAIALAPKLHAAHLGLGIALIEQAQNTLAADCLRHALQLQPDHALTHDQFGVALHACGELQSALQHLRRAVHLKPNFASAHYHLANLLLELEQPEAAASSFSASIALEPQHARVFANFGVALMALKRSQEAVDALRNAVALDPMLGLAHTNLGNALALNGHYSEALGCQHQAVALEPENTLVHTNLAHLLKTLGQPGLALEHLERVLLLEPERMGTRSEILFTRQYITLDFASRETSRSKAQEFGALATRLATPFLDWPNFRQSERCLRVGLVSGDLRLHPVGYFLESVLAALGYQSNHGEGQLEFWVYANHPLNDTLSLRLQKHCHAWRQVATTGDGALAAQIRADAIDILVDLSGHTLHNRLPVFAYKPAPVQLSWLGYCATTGLDSITAFIADPWTVPQECEGEFTERVVHLPATFLCFTPPDVKLAVTPLPALSGRGIRFGCFNHLAKMNDDVVRLWASILEAVPESSLVLQAQPLCDPTVRQQMEYRFAVCGISPGRLILQPAQLRADYLAAYGQIDIALDPFPYPGGTTSLEALWMGVPVLTLAGDCALARQGVSILQNVGLPDWVATCPNDYLTRAQRHAADLANLSTIRSELRERLLASSLCDAPLFAMHFKAALRVLWQGWCDTA